jgi:hypothetical protein
MKVSTANALYPAAAADPSNMLSHRALLSLQAQAIATAALRRAFGLHHGDFFDGLGDFVAQPTAPDVAGEQHFDRGS